MTTGFLVDDAGRVTPGDDGLVRQHGAILGRRYMLTVSAQPAMLAILQLAVMNALTMARRSG